jgi:type IV pilus assembly protein PilY1
MKTTTWIVILGLSALIGVSTVSQAEDTDLFVANPGIEGGRPNVLIILDNTANWSASAAGTTKFALEKAALQSVFSQLPEGRFNIGLMLFTETGQGNSNPSGGYVRYAIR